MAFQPLEISTCSLPLPHCGSSASHAFPSHSARLYSAWSGSCFCSGYSLNFSVCRSPQQPVHTESICFSNVIKELPKYKFKKPNNHPHPALLLKLLILFFNAAGLKLCTTMIVLFLHLTLGGYHVNPSAVLIYL